MASDKQPPASSIPDVEAPTRTKTGIAEDDFFNLGLRQSHRLRRWSGYGALLIAVALYGCGLYAIGVMLGVFKSYASYTSHSWHVDLAIIASLFTVPTVLFIAVLKSSKQKEDESADSLHAAIGQGLVKLLERVIDK